MKMVLTYFFLASHFLYAQTAHNITTNKSITLSPQNHFLFVQDNCEACEIALQNISQCEDKIKNSYSIVAIESESWARQLQTSEVIKRMKPQNFYLMSFSEAKKMKVFGTPTYLPGLDKKLRYKTCDQLKKEMKM